MVFLRSEEHRDRWLAANGWEPGSTLTAEQMNELARRWLETYEAPAIDPGMDEALLAFIRQKKESMPDAFT